MPTPRKLELMTVKEFAEATRIGTRSIYRAVENGTIRSMRLGPRNIRIPAAELTRVLGELVSDDAAPAA